jgi:hypothetical protein
MWKVREAKQIGVITFWEVYKIMPGGETIFRGKWKYKAEAQALADRLNREEAERERIQ